MKIEKRKLKKNILLFAGGSLRNEPTGRRADATIKGFRDQIKMIVKSKAQPVFKTRLLETRVRSFVEIARHAKTAFDQMVELKRWLHQKTRGIAATYKEVNGVPWLLMDLWKERRIDRMFLTQPNFFWDVESVGKERFIDCFSPYREPN